MLKKFGLMSLMLLVAAGIQAATAQKTVETKKAVQTKQTVETAAPAEETSAIPAKKNISFGMKAGLNFLTFQSYGMISLMTNKKPGITGGLFMEMGGENVKFQPEVLFLSGGTEIGDMTMSFTCLEMPLHAKFYLNSASAPNRLHVFVGPSALVVLSAKMKEKDEAAEDFMDMLNQMNLSLSGGVGLESGKVTLDLRYSTGLTSVTKEGEGPDGVDLGVNTLNLMLGYKFN